MNMRIAISVLLAVAMSGCTVQQTGRHGTIKPVDTQKVLDNHIDLAFRYISRKDRELARTHLEKAKQIDASDSRIYTCYALIYEVEGEEKLAEENFLQAIRSSSADTRARFYYGVFLSSRNRPKEAREQFRRVIQNVDYANRAMAFIRLGYTELELGNDADARAAFEKALRLDKSYAPAYLAVAEMEYTAGNYVVSRQYLKQYNGLSRPSPRSLWLGVRVENKFQNKDAEASYGLALKNLFPNSKENLAYQEWLKHAEQ